ncbi:hypothetical protein BDV28DRAFT_145107 [Aspergillus coremiiformis]|uniref:Uncharacterized protein n=1 Tax=Aspergillus coremiiformis TaxID=138285 RepID=A0A5N6ZI41_9EURO|nr:hypothetical protein BDV28DRAFT_145107 [Aspergillus coremiiformis]
MRASTLATIALAACSAASPLGSVPQARGVAAKSCDCEGDSDDGAPEGPSAPKLPSLPPFQMADSPPVPGPTGVPDLFGFPFGLPSSFDVPTVPGNSPAVPGNGPTAPGNDPTMPGIIPTLPGIIPTLPGNVPTVPGNSPAVPGNDPTVPGNDPTVPGIIPTLPGIIPTLPGNADHPEDPEDPEEPSKGGCDGHGCHGTGHLIQDLGPQANHILTIVGLHTEQLLVQLSPGVADLLVGLGLLGIGQPVGHIIKSAVTIAELIADLGSPVQCLLTVIGQDGGYLLIALDMPLTGLLTGLGLPSIAEPVGTIVGTVGQHLKRNHGLLEDLAPTVKCMLKIIGADSKILLIELSEPVASLFIGLGLAQLAEPVGSVIMSAALVGDLVYDLGSPVKCTLTILGEDGGALLVQLSPAVASLLAGVGLPGVGVPAGHVVKTLDLTAPVQSIRH